jgi:syntaxin 6
MVATRCRRDRLTNTPRSDQQLIHQQDNVLSSLSGTLTNLASMAGLIGGEVQEQNEWVLRGIRLFQRRASLNVQPRYRLLDDLSTRVDATDSRLTRANKRMRQFVRKNEGERCESALRRRTWRAE